MNSVINGSRSLPTHHLGVSRRRRTSPSGCEPTTRTSNDVGAPPKKKSSLPTNITNITPYPYTRRARAPIVFLFVLVFLRLLKLFTGDNNQDVILDTSHDAATSLIPRPICIQSSNNYQYVPCPSTDTTVQLKEYWARNDRSLPGSDDNDDDDWGDCKPREDWRHSRPYPTCNTFHERWDSVSGLSEIDEGSTTQVFEMINGDTSLANGEASDRWVFKMDFLEPEGGGNADKEAETALLERLTVSPYIPSIYGVCAASTLAPFASSGTLYDLINSIRFGGSDLIDKSLDTLKISVQVASGLAALHDTDESGRTAFAHNDLDTSQIVYNEQTQVYQLNDFNYGKFTLYGDSGEACKAKRSGMNAWKARAPEDIAAYLKVGPPFHIDKADIYSLGVVLFMVLTNQWLWEDESTESSTAKALKGARPPIPEEFVHSKDRAIQAVIKAIDMCWVFDPDERASAQAVADFLSEELSSIRPGEDVRIVLPPLFEYQDDDYTAKMKIHEPKK